MQSVFTKYCRDPRRVLGETRWCCGPCPQRARSLHQPQIFPDMSAFAVAPRAHFRRRRPERAGHFSPEPNMARQFVYHMQGLSKSYPGNRKVLENVNLSFYPDAKIGVLGVNGSGKSTLLRIM